MRFVFGRALVFFMIGLPIGFILSALAFTITGREIIASELAPFALGISVIAGIGAVIWKPTQ